MSAKKKILFVDDEKRVLDGLRRMLRPLRKCLDMYFVESGREALELMAETKMDIIISDMRMPGMDGAELLTQVQKRFPETVRIVLTGQSSVEATMRTIGIAHQFLDKPCEPERLRDVIQRALFIKRLMSHSAIEKIVAGIGTLPSLPSVYAEIQEKLSDPESSVEEVARCIEKDVAMCAKILQLVNSAFFGHFKPVESPAKAVHLLGLETVKALVLSLHIFTQYQGNGGLPFSIEALWRHSLCVGNLAKKIAAYETNNQKLMDEAFLAGLLHDIGKLILATGLPDKYQKVIEILEQEDIELYEAESRVFKAGHAEIGGYLLGLWGLPGSIVETIIYHHHQDRYPSNEFDIMTAVSAANVFDHEMSPDHPIGANPAVDLVYLERIGCSQKLEKWREICRAEQENMYE